MTVYVVWDGYEDTLGVFSGREAAERAIEAHMQKRNERAVFKISRDHYSISAHVIDLVDEKA